MNKEIEIPEGYEARIEGNKVILEPKESEDEKIIKEIIEFINWSESYGAMRADLHQQKCPEKWIAYLERQKEQRPIPKFKVGDRIYDKRDSYNRNVIREVGKDYYINAFAQKMDMAYTDANFEFLEHLDNDLVDNKPAEWSEEDEKTIDEAVEYIENYAEYVQGEFSKQHVLDLARRVDSLRPQPHWKPSEEQMKIIYDCSGIRNMWIYYT